MTESERIGLPQSEAERKAFNRLVASYRHKWKMGGQMAFKTALTHWRMGKAFQSLGLASMLATETFERLGNALKGLVKSIRSEVRESDRE
jgi:hypothetical protein